MSARATPRRLADPEGDPLKPLREHVYPAPDASSPRSRGEWTASLSGPDRAGSVAIVGGCGHVGLPLGVAFASRGLDVTLYDLDEPSVGKVNGGTMPFDEPGAPEALAAVLESGHLRASTDPRVIADVEHVIVVI